MRLETMWRGLLVPCAGTFWSGRGVMTIEQSHGQARPTLPRSSDLLAAKQDQNGQQESTTGARTAPLPRLRFDKSWNEYFAQQLGRDAEGGAGELGEKAWRLYRGLLKELPCVTVSVRACVAA